MTNALHAPEVRFQVRLSADVDEHATHLSDWRQEYDQLSRGHFDGAVRELWLAGLRLQVFHEFTGPQTSQRCRPWPGSVWFGIPDGIGDGPLHFSGRRQADGPSRVLMSARADEGFVLRTPQRFGIYGVVVEEARLATHLGARAGAPARQGAWATPLSVHRHTALCQTLEAMLSLGTRGEAEQPWGQQALRLLAEQLLGLLGQCGEEADAPRLHDPRVERALALVMAARDLAADPFNSLLSVDDLCRRLHLTPRTLHNHFQRTVGESPAEFLRAVRLNACRRRLRGASELPCTVQEVASQWGFFHMGRFSQEYRALFGQAPSQTLRDARAAVPAPAGH